MCLSLVAVSAATGALLADSGDRSYSTLDLSTDGPYKDSGMYVGFGAGGNFMQDTRSKGLPGFGPAGTAVAFNHGVRLDGTVGYRFDSSWAVEVEGGFAGNQISSIGGVKPLTDIFLYQYPVLANVVYRYPLGEHWRVWAGVGAGAVWSTLDFNGIVDDTDLQYAYQAKAGVGYAVGKTIEFSICYKFLGTGDHSWNIVGDPGNTEGNMSHSVMAAITLKF